MASTLYQDLLGDSWTALGAGARLAHSVPISGRGEFDVVWGSSWLARQFARTMYMPPAGKKQPVSLELVANGESVRWIREFAEFHFETEHRREGDLLLERFGAVQILFRLSAQDGKLVYSQVGIRYGRIRLPRFISLRVDAQVSDSPSGWLVHVVVNAPILGEICRYGGELSIV